MFCAVQSLTGILYSPKYVRFSVATTGRQQECWCLFGRVKVPYDKEEGLWLCDCSKNYNQKRSCLDKYMEKWFAFENMPSILKSNATMKDVFVLPLSDEEEHIVSTKSKCKVSPSVSTSDQNNLKHAIEYLKTVKSYPLTIPVSVLHNDTCGVSELIPSKEKCSMCKDNPGLGKPVVATKNATVLGLTGVTEGVTVSKKFVPHVISRVER